MAHIPVRKYPSGKTRYTANVIGPPLLVLTVLR